MPRCLDELRADGASSVVCSFATLGSPCEGLGDPLGGATWTGGACTSGELRDADLLGLPLVGAAAGAATGMITGAACCEPDALGIVGAAARSSSSLWLSTAIQSGSTLARRVGTRELRFFKHDWITFFFGDEIAGEDGT